MTILFYRNKNEFMISGQTCVIFTNLRGNKLLLCFVLMFCFRIENSYFVVHSERRNFKCMCFAI